MATMNLYELDGVCREFPDTAGRSRCALVDLTCRIPAHAMTVVSGPSGAGKSTLLSLLGGLDRPTRGDIQFDGRSLAHCSDHELTRVRRRVGFVFQEFALLPGLTVLDNIVYPLIPRGIARRDRVARATTWLERLGMFERRHERPERLSGGERQRVALARALAADPAVVLADEPTSNLDPATSRLVRDILRELHQAGRTLVLATHDAELSVGASQTIRLDAGRIVAESLT